MRTKTKTTITSLAAALASLALVPSAFAGQAKPVKATGLKVAAPTTATAGTPFDATVTAVTKQGKRVKDFRGKVSLSAGQGATVPGAHKFSRTDAGRYTFRGIELQRPGAQTIAAVSGKVRGGADVAVAAGQIATIELSAPARADAGQSFDARVIARDAKGNELGDQTAQATLSLSGGECRAGSCTAAAAGSRTLSARVGDATDEVQVEVAPGAASRLDVTADNSRAVLPARIDVAHGWISPRSGVDVDEARRFSARAFDAYGNDLGDVSSSASFSVDGVACQGAVCKGTTPGSRQVSATMGDARGAAEMQVASYEDTYYMGCQQMSVPNYMASTAHFLDMDGQIANGCEVENELAGIGHFSMARDLGSKPCHDGSSKIDETVTLMRDGRGNRASAYFKVKTTGGWTCVNDTVLDVEISGGKTDEKCFQIGTWFGGDATREHTEGDILMGGDEKVRLADGHWYQSGMNVYFKVQQICGQGVASPQVRITGHL